MQDPIFDTTTPPRWTPDFRSEAANKLAELFPEVLADGKIDFEALKTLLAEDLAEPNERFGLFWPGKQQAMRAAQTPTSATLAPDLENSVDWDSTQNVFIEGDNLEVLKILQKHYYGQIKMIYIDPPYNTGKDFVYKDDYSDPLGSYLKMTGQADGEGRLSTNTESDGRFHSNWLNMMYPRLKLAKNLLRNDGLIMMSLDDTEYALALTVMREIFGEANVIGTLIHQRAKGGGKAKYIVKGHDYIIVAARNINLATSLVRRKQVQGKTVTINDIEYIKDDDVVRRSFGKYDRNMDRRCFYEELESVKGINKKAEIDEKISEGTLFLEWREDVKMHVIYRLIPTSDATSKIYSIIKALSEKGKEDLANLEMGDYFPYPKSIELVSQLLEAATMLDRNSTVLDFFAGSGTTAHAVMALNSEDGGNRRCISVQLPESTDSKEYQEACKANYKTISEITRERIRRAGKKILEEESGKLNMREEPLDVGFRAYKLADSSFTRWNLSSDISEENLQEQLQVQADSSKDHATPESKLTELLLRLGLSLTEKIETVSISDLEVFSVADGLLLAYTKEQVKPSLEQLRALVAAQPAKLVILENAFQGDDELKTNLTQECRAHGVDLYTA